MGPARRRIAARGAGRQHRLSRDGALRAGANADLAADADLVIIAEPMAHVFGPGSAVPGAGAVIRLIPDSDAIQAFGPDITSLATWVPAYQAGIRQAPQAARLIEACHLGSQRPSWPWPQQ